ncbi:tRNA wybutosine-synthesizing protein 2/3/4 [Primulina huaijiensis]|uniref:tRNA wybutosine-synthesizing protein 2/3/4 n=1 Tax=Primulina huaijiensis TaxID=1492673 RepID=UPI003CC78EE1
MVFDKRKAAAMIAMNSPEPDNSPKGTLDLPIVPLLNAINSHPSFFTTSSCSGRISVFSHPTNHSALKKKAKGGTWIFISHDPVHPSSLLPLLYPASSDPPPSRVTSESDHLESHSIVFRFEPLIIAVECRDLEAAQCLVSLAISSGFRESGITSVSKRVIIAIRCSIRLEVPLGDSIKLVVSQEYVEYLVGVANEKMEANRKRTDLFLSTLIKNGFSSSPIPLEGEVLGCGSEKYSEVKRIETLGNSVGNVVAGQEGKLSSETNGSCKVISFNLSTVEVDGEPVERLFLWGHSACSVDQKKILIFGGFGGIGRHERKNDLVLLDAQSGMVEIVAVMGTPSARLGHTCSVVGDFMYVIGGRADPLNILNDVWVFDMANNEWKFLQCSGSLFPPRHRHAAAVVGSKIYVFGGIYNDKILSSLYVLDTLTSEWTEIETRGNWPGPLHSHSMESNCSKLYMFGGYNGEKALGDLYSFDVETSLWNKMKTYGVAPNARFSHSMFIYSNYLGVLGGCPVSGYQELSLLNLLSYSWKTIRMQSIEESLFVRSTVSVIGDNLVIVGGGASCYAFGTKFSQPMKVDLRHLPSICHDSEFMGQKEENNRSFLYSHKTELKVNQSALQDSTFEELRGNNGGLVITKPWVLRLDKKYAKLGKDVLKNFGWLDLGRKVYTLDGKMLICFPVTEKFSAVFEDMSKVENNVEVSNDQQSWTACSFDMSKGISTPSALNLLKACGATKIVDEVANIKKTPTTPFKVMKEAVAPLLNHHRLPSELIEQLPLRWERVGDMIVLPTTSFKDPMWDSIGKELWPIVAKSLGTGRLARQNRIAQNGTRDSKLEILVGDGGWVDHRENGILYSFDTTKCMFSWGNLSEKLRMARLECKDQVIVDLFAGIGYFTLPFLLRANAKMVYACEWNPHAIEALHRNLLANSVADRCVVLEGDNRVTAPKGVADRVCLGLLPSSECSWVTAVEALRDEGGILHIHGNVKDTGESSWTNHVVHSISDIAKSQGLCWEVSVDHLEKVKWYAPHIRHLVVDVRCRLRQK